MPDENVFAIPQLRRVYKATYALLPTTGLKAGDLGYATDRLVFYRWSGAAWEAITIHSSSGLAANIPAAADLPEGSLYYETDTTLLKQVQSGAWVTLTHVAYTNADADARIAIHDAIVDAHHAKYTDAEAIAAVGISIVPKTADEIVNNSITPQNDDHLFLSVGANEVWHFVLILRGYTPTSNVGIDTKFTVPSGGAVYRLPDTWAAQSGLAETDWTNEFNSCLTPDTGYKWAVLRGHYIGGGNAGTLQFQWAQRTATAEDTKLKQNSVLIAWRVA